MPNPHPGPNPDGAKGAEFREAAAGRQRDEKAEGREAAAGRQRDEAAGKGRKNGTGGRHAWETGRKAEDSAEKFLAAKGYTVIGRNLRLGRGELDLVAWDGDVLVFVEVKARSGRSLAGALEAVGRDKQKRLASAAADYLSRLSQPWPVCRFDVLAMAPGGGNENIRHLPDAFRPGGW